MPARRHVGGVPDHFDINDKWSNMQTNERKRRARRGRGEGSVFRRADGYWVANVSAGFNADGKRRRRTVYGKTKKEVQDKLRAMGLSGSSIDAVSMTLETLLVRWLDSKETTVAPNTHANYKWLVEKQVKPRMGRMRLSSIAPLHVEAFYNEMAKDGASPRMRQLAGIVLSNALTYAVRMKLIPHNPAREIPKPRSVRRELFCWTAEQAAKFLEATEGDRLHGLYVLALATGMRQGELFGLHWTDVDFEGGYLVVRRSLENRAGAMRLKEPKTGKGRRIDLPAFALDALNAHRQQSLAEGTLSDAVFVAPDGNYLQPSNMRQRSFDKAIERAGVPKIRFHDLRHTHATLLLAAGENVKVVSERLGHSTVKMTLEVYAHVLPGMQKQAADRMQKLLG